MVMALDLKNLYMKLLELTNPRIICLKFVTPFIPVLLKSIPTILVLLQRLTRQLFRLRFYWWSAFDVRWSVLVCWDFNYMMYFIILHCVVFIFPYSQWFFALLMLLVPSFRVVVSQSTKIFLMDLYLTKVNQITETSSYPFK